MVFSTVESPRKCSCTPAIVAAWLIAAFACVLVVQLAAPLFFTENETNHAYGYTYIDADRLFEEEDESFYVADEDGNKMAENQEVVTIYGAAEMLNSTGVYLHVCNMAYATFGDEVTSTDYTWFVTVNGETPPASEGTNEDGYIIEQTQKGTDEDPWEVYRIVIPSVKDGDEVSLGWLFQWKGYVGNDDSSETYTTETRHTDIIAAPPEDGLIEGEKYTIAKNDDDIEAEDESSAADNGSDRVDQEEAGSSENSADTDAEDEDGNSLLVPVVIVVIVIVLIGVIWTLVRGRNSRR